MARRPLSVFTIHIHGTVISEVRANQERAPWSLYGISRRNPGCGMQRLAPRSSDAYSMPKRLETEPHGDAEPFAACGANPHD
jgi:hypothetical protein